MGRRAIQPLCQREVLMCGRGRFVALIVIGLIGGLGASVRAVAQDSTPTPSAPDPNVPAPSAPDPNAPPPGAPDPNAPAPAQPEPSPPPQAVTPPPAPTPEKAPPPAVKVFDRAEIQGVLGRDVRSKAGENMGRVVQVIVDRTNGLARAAIIDFGGFLGVGSRRIAVAWDALQFAMDQNSERITLDLTRDQVKDAPEYKEGRPIMVLTRSGASETIPDER
jgi:hypothetical protein